MARRAIALAVLVLLPFEALAQEAAASGPVPPGEGMIEQPCPDQKGLWFGHAYVKQNDWPWLCRFRQDNARRTEPSRPDVVFIGDSITEGWGRTDPGFFTAGNANRGISGQTSPQMLLRFWQDVIALKPRAVHIMAGTNDIAGNTGPTSAEAYRNNIRAMVALARANGIMVIIGSILPADRFGWKPAMRPASRVAELDAWLRDFARTEGLVYADYYAAMVAPGGGLRADLGDDGVHPDARGYAVMRPIAEAAIRQALASPAPRKSRHRMRN